MERTVKVLDASSLKALAHPLRVRLLGLLRMDGPSTATALGERLGESSGTTSYHLRQLEAVGMVRDAVGLGNGRERWWEAAQDETRLDPVDFAGAGAEVQASISDYLSTVLSTYARRAGQFVAEQGTWSRTWVAAAELSDWQLSLTAKELRRLSAELEALVESYRRDPRRGDEQVVVQVQAFPRRSGS